MFFPKRSSATTVMRKYFLVKKTNNNNKKTEVVACVQTLLEMEKFMNQCCSAICL